MRSAVQPAVPAEEGGEAAFAFVRALFLQRDAQLAVEGCDKAGTFLGRLSAGASLVNLRPCRVDDCQRFAHRPLVIYAPRVPSRCCVVSLH
jgi:hypothetical protein